MKTANAWAWLTAGVLALGLNGFYQDGGAAWAHRVVRQVTAGISDESGEALALAVGRADGLVAKVNAIAERDEAASCRLGTTMARLQTKWARAQGEMARFEAASARGEAQLARLEADRARMEAQVAGARTLAEFSP